ncbi:hypothetical protein BREVUG8_100546 [Brevundimonas sp. G8]|nr:hypothetical protein BREVUG8_100546 [Brevundimonas sp. G8]
MAIVLRRYRHLNDRLTLAMGQRTIISGIKGVEDPLPVNREAQTVPKTRKSRCERQYV